MKAKIIPSAVICEIIISAYFTANYKLAAWLFSDKQLSKY